MVRVLPITNSEHRAISTSGPFQFKCRKTDWQPERQKYSVKHGFRDLPDIFLPTAAGQLTDRMNQALGKSMYGRFLILARKCESPPADIWDNLTKPKEQMG